MLLLFDEGQVKSKATVKMFCKVTDVQDMVIFPFADKQTKLHMYLILSYSVKSITKMQTACTGTLIL